MLKAIKKTRIHEEVVAQLHQLIEAGKLRAGDRLPSERELAETFRVSRSSVREAIRLLEREGFVVSRPGSGTFIAAVDVEALVQPLASLLSRGKHALLDLFEMRRLVEPGIAALAAERATPADILRLKEILTEQERQMSQGASAVESDAAFHFAIGQATHNSALQRLVASIVDILKPAREQSLQTPGRAHQSLASHREILVAIERHDPEFARHAMQRHIEAVEQSVLAAGTLVHQPGEPGSAPAVTPPAGAAGRGSPARAGGPQAAGSLTAPAQAVRRQQEGGQR
jgi:GntR family transcriptional repressor for pyruvate dehydrogenase complex